MLLMSVGHGGPGPAWPGAKAVTSSHGRQLGPHGSESVDKLEQRSLDHQIDVPVNANAPR